MLAKAVRAAQLPRPGASLEDAGTHPLAALLYESVLAGEWHNRFGSALKTVTREEYVRLLRAVRKGKSLPGQQPSSTASANAGGAETAADLRMSITWNTDATDVDLWVIEPDGKGLLSVPPRSSSGGESVAGPDPGVRPGALPHPHGAEGRVQDPFTTSGQPQLAWGRDARQRGDHAERRHGPREDRAQPSSSAVRRTISSLPDSVSDSGSRRTHMRVEQEIETRQQSGRIGAACGNVEGRGAVGRAGDERSARDDRYFLGDR